jgi:arylsulfatase A-like enzyme
MESRLALAIIVCFSGFTCNPQEPPAAAHAKSEEGAKVVEPVDASAEAASRTETTPALAKGATGMAVHQDLQALLHLADIYDPTGLFVDFGTASRLKYTNGNWNSGWLGESREAGATVSTFGKTARLYLPVDKQVPMQLRLRVKPYASGTLIVYVNGKTVGEVSLNKADGFRERVIPVRSDALVVGENAIMLRATRTAPVRGKSRSVAVDWLLLEPRAEGNEQLATPKGVALTQVEAGGGRLAVTLEPGARVDWFIDVPKGGALAFAVAAPGASGALDVEVSSDSSRSAETVSATSKWSDRQIALSRIDGQLARIRFSNEGGADVSLADVRVVRPAKQPVAIEQPAKNVVVLLIDTLRASKLQPYYPKSRVTTPAIDRFVSEGALFERAQSPENWTKPAVASVLTSLHPATHNTKQDASKLPRSALMLSEVYKKAGFKTASFIANGYVSNAFGFDQGWDHYTNYIRERRNTNASNVFGEAQSWIRKNKDGRFFVYIQTIDPHVPYDPPDEFLKMYDAKPYSGQVQNRRTHLMLDEAKKNPKKYKFTARDKERIEALHDGEISYHDAYFDKFLAMLDELGLSEDTIVVVTSDHGEEFQEHGSWGHGHSVYQELLGVPLLFRWPGVIPANLRIEPAVSTMDIGPTVLEATGVPIPEAFEGRSLLGFMRGDWPLGPYVAFSDFLDHRRVIRGGDWKLIIRGNLSQVMFDLGNDYWEQEELDGRAHPIAQRYLRTLHGQFLGASDRGRWLAGSTGTTAPKKKGLEEEKQQMTPELCKQLVALGYISAECDALLSN